MNHCEIRAEPMDDTLTLRVIGELDAASAPMLQEEVSGWLMQGSRRVLIDLSEVTFLDSRGLKVLLTLTEGSSSGREVQVSNPSRVVERLLAAASLTDRIPIVDA